MQKGPLSLAGLWFWVGVMVSILVLSHGAEPSTTNAPCPSTEPVPSIVPNIQRKGTGPVWEAETWELGHRGVELGLRNQERVRLESHDRGFGCREVDAEIQARELELLQR